MTDPLPEHHMECRVCGQNFDMRDLGAVFSHEHKGLTDDPEVREQLGGITPGVSIAGPDPQPAADPEFPLGDGWGVIP